MTYLFVDTDGLPFETHITVVEELNRAGLEGIADVTKLSFYVWFKLKEKYELLIPGATLGFGCCPLLVSKTGTVNHNYHAMCCS